MCIIWLLYSMKASICLVRIPYEVEFRIKLYKLTYVLYESLKGFDLNSECGWIWSKVIFKLTSVFQECFKTFDENSEGDEYRIMLYRLTFVLRDRFKTFG